ncbi:MAG: proton-translocating NADH-quinone oxidoreductase, chain [Paenibacillaceae bacterium]|nr:proton-translocating NADH-quinone oxidoreductase, chain [Paenibacillaceae bacterium]
MIDQLPMLTLIAFSPLIGVLILLFVSKENGRAIKVIGIATTMIPLLLSAWLYADFLTRTAVGFQYSEQHEWLRIALNHEMLGDQIKSFIYEFKYNLVADGLSLPLVFLTALVGSMAALASVLIKKRWKTYFILFLLLEIGMFGVFLAQDLFLFFLFFEVTLVTTFFLIGIWGYEKSVQAANKFLIYNGIGSAVMLIAFFIIVNTAGYTQENGPDGLVISYSGDLHAIMNNLFSDTNAMVHVQPDPQQFNPFFLSNTMKWTLFIMLVVAFGIKLPIFPFHTWMLKVHMEAPPSVVMIHSGILLKMGAYGLIRFGILLFPEQAKGWAVVLAVLGVVNILYGAALAFVQKDFKLVLAYSSISHMGIVLLGIAALNPTGLGGAVFQMVSHGLISALMFLIVGCLYERTKTTTLSELGGLAASIPFISGILLVAGMASLGLPGLSGFVGEFLSFLGLFATMKGIATVGILGIILAAVYVLRAVLRITFGKRPESMAGFRDARLVEAVPMIVLVAFIVLLGVYPAVLSHPLNQSLIGFDQLIQTLNLKIGG